MACSAQPEATRTLAPWTGTGGSLDADLTRVLSDSGSGKFSLTGEIDLSNADRIGQILEEALSKGHRVILDLKGLTFMDSQGLRMLLSVALLACEKQLLPVALVNPSHAVRRLLDVATPQGIPGVEIR